jgi:hypothetical protein
MGREQMTASPSVDVKIVMKVIIVMYTLNNRVVTMSNINDRPREAGCVVDDKSLNHP